MSPLFAAVWCRFRYDVLVGTRPGNSEVRPARRAACIARVRCSSIKIPHITAQSPCRLSDRQASMRAATAFPLEEGRAPSSSRRGARDRNVPASLWRVVRAQA